MPMNDPYQVIGVARTASQDEIKSAYRNLAKKYHPDLNPGNKEAESKFKEISHAYDFIGTPESRQKYDRGEFEEHPPGGSERGPFYRQTQENGPQGGRYTYSFNGQGLDEDFFESLFGNAGQEFGGARQGRRQARGPQWGPTQGEDQLYRMDIDLKDSIRGAEKEITLPSGKRLSIKIPAGIHEGARLRFAGQGSPGLQGSSPGDAYIEVHVREDPDFKRDGDNLIIELPISLTKAVFGGEVRAPTVDGEVLLKIPPHSNTGRKLKLAGKGAYNPQTKTRADQIIVLQIMLPDPLDAELETALRDWQKRHSHSERERGAA